MVFALRRLTSIVATVWRRDGSLMPPNDGMSLVVMESSESSWNRREKGTCIRYQ